MCFDPHEMLIFPSHFQHWDEITTFEQNYKYSQRKMHENESVFVWDVGFERTSCSDIVLDLIRSGCFYTILNVDIQNLGAILINRIHQSPPQFRININLISHDYLWVLMRTMNSLALCMIFTKYMRRTTLFSLVLYPQLTTLFAHNKGTHQMLVASQLNTNGLVFIQKHGAHWEQTHLILNLVTGVRQFIVWWRHKFRRS